MGSCIPIVYFEPPLLGEPRFDLQVCINRADVMGECELPATAPDVLEPLLCWLRENDDCLGIDLSFDEYGESLRASQVMALMRDGSLRDAEGFFSVVEDPRAAERFRRAAQQAPTGWKPWYVGFAGGRPGRPVRLDYSVSPKTQLAYLGGTRSSRCA